MNFERTNLEGLYVLKPKVIEDERGFLMEVYNQKNLRGAGIDVEFVQENHSRSQKGVLRGLHFQWDPPLGKLIRVIRGGAYMVAVDIRKRSETLGQWAAFNMTDENKIEIYAPPGFATGFCVTQDFADMEYHYTVPFNPRGESRIIWNDVKINVSWPVKDPVLSARDKNAQSLESWLDSPESNVFL